MHQRKLPPWQKLGFKSAADHLVAICDLASDNARRKAEEEEMRAAAASRKPGDGKNHRQQELGFALWNCCGLSNERLFYVKEEVQADVIGLVELHDICRL